MSAPRTRGYDFANVWLNFLKIVLGLLIVYRYALTDQLKIDVFRSYHIVDSTLSRQLADADNPRVQIRFIPVVVRGRMDEITLRVTREGGSSPLVWTMEKPKPGGVQEVSVPLEELLQASEGGGIESGSYTLNYAIDFRQEGQTVHTWPEADAAQPAITVDYSADTRALGTIVITRGQSASYPDVLRQRTHQFAAGLSSSIVADESRNAGRFVASWNAPLGGSQVSGNFTDGKREKFTLELYVIANQPPMSICGSAPTRINLYYDSREFIDTYQAYGLDLSMCVIDPDGKTFQPTEPEEGFLLGRWAVQANVAVQTISIASAPAGYRIGQRRGKFYLLVTGRGPAPGAAGDELTLLADGHRIEAVVQRMN